MLHCTILYSEDCCSQPHRSLRPAPRGRYLEAQAHMYHGLPNRHWPFAQLPQAEMEIAMIMLLLSLRAVCDICLIAATPIAFAPTPHAGIVSKTLVFTMVLCPPQVYEFI